MFYRAWFDASIKNKSIAVGYTVLSHNNKLVKELGYKTENKKIKNIQSAESFALNNLLNYLVNIRPAWETYIVGDNQTLINQILNREYDDRVYRLNANIEFFIRNKHFKIEWQSRNHNHYTDNIVRLAHSERIQNNGGKIVL